MARLLRKEPIGPHRRGAGTVKPPRPLSPTEKREALKLAPIVKRFRAEGITTAPRMAQALNNNHVLTAHGVRWSPAAVAALLARIDGSAAQ